MDKPSRDEAARFGEMLISVGSKRVDPAEEVCPLCNGMGMRVVSHADGRRMAMACECRSEGREERILRRSGVPERYMQCALDNYNYNYAGAHTSLWKAFNQARGFATNYPHRIQGVGLIFTGSVGTGKTHLAVGILRSLVLEKGRRALFCDHRGLLKAVNNSYNPNVATTEMEVLRPVFEAEVLVIDELGSAKKTEWVSDIVEHILNTRYNDHRTTIITTNYPNLPAGRLVGDTQPESAAPAAGALLADSSGYAEPGLSPLDNLRNDVDRRSGRGFGDLQGDPSPKPLFAPGTAKSPANQRFLDYKGKRMIGGETLGDRIGERMRSRLAEMCVTVEITGKDYRQDAKKAHF